MITKYIGQTEIVSEINEMIQAFDNQSKKGESYAWRPLLFGGYTGTGKSNLARAISQQLEDKGFNFIEMPPNAGMRELYAMAEKTASFDEEKGLASAIPYIIFWDEFHAQKAGKDLLKSLTTEVTKSHTLMKQGHCFHYDPTCHLHIFATNEQIDKALARRCRQFTLGAYKPAEMEKIAELFLSREGVSLDESGMKSLLSRVKPFPGDLEEVVAPLVNRAKARGIAKLKGDDVTELLKQRGFFPRGYRREDLTIMQYIVKEGHATADTLRFKVKDDKKKNTLDRINFLASEGMIAPVRGGWQLDKAGVTYLEDIISKQKANKAAKAKA